ncbi:hypothetical protein PGC08_05775 [Brevibacterium sp. BDJS002]|uniref:hypothetical protein n=1 Tax=Brevibacterium sp. BDJS002 TaxID=3020906 RepID=UPI0023071B03|nr:hypothetical protein [Brevibacterium sp. BDJS002]WCE41191.1 hypothetical protein PGC08_05775 [Brevibacterium sp. BDJS002]
MRTDLNYPDGDAQNLGIAVEDFVKEIVATIDNSIVCDLVLSDPVVTPRKVTASNPQGGFRIGVQMTISAMVYGAPTYRVEADYVLVWNRTRKFVAVFSSTFALLIEGSNEPLFHYDYLLEPQGKNPGAHLNIHHDRDDVRQALAKGGDRYKAKARNRSGTLRDSELHYPLGGPRFRPCLEDIIQFMIYELGVDPKEQWHRTLSDGRIRWRDRQLRAAVADNLHVAAQVLRDHDFEVLGGPEPDRNDVRITEL